jgi:hypothetical protein
MAAAEMKCVQPAVQGNVKLTELRSAIARSTELQRACIHTVRLMTRMGLLGEAVAEFRARAGASESGEEVVRQFMAKMSAHPNALVSSMAQFEAALRKVRDGAAGRHGMEWDRNPNEVFRALDEGADLPPSEGISCYFVEVAAELPGLVCCTRFAAPFTAPQSPDTEPATA